MQPNRVALLICHVGYELGVPAACVGGSVAPVFIAGVGKMLRQPPDGWHDAARIDVVSDDASEQRANLESRGWAARFPHE